MIDYKRQKIENINLPLKIIKNFHPSLASFFFDMPGCYLRSITHNETYLFGEGLKREEDDI
jgi:hypothetical protein